jgi:hypothetical protein
MHNVLFVLARLSMLDGYVLKINQFRQNVPVLASTLLPEEHVFISRSNQ